MNKKIIFPAILFAVVLIISVAVLTTNKDDNQPSVVLTTNKANNQLNNDSVNRNSEPSGQSGIILFYGDGCPHCALVEQYVSENNIESKVQFTKKEVYNNQQNASELTAKAKACGMATDSIGVPFLWDGSTCLVGDQPIIDFFKQKAGQ